MLASLLDGVLFVLPLLVNVITVLIIASVVMDWVSADPYNPYVQLTKQLTEPMFRPFRRITQKFTGPFDLAPMLALFTLMFLHGVLKSLLPKLIIFVS